MVFDAGVIESSGWKLSLRVSCGAMPCWCLAHASGCPWLVPCWRVGLPWRWCCVVGNPTR